MAAPIPRRAPLRLAALALTLLAPSLAATAASARTVVSRDGGTVRIANGAEGAHLTIADSFVHEGNSRSTKLYAGRNCENPWNFSHTAKDLTMVRCSKRSGWKVVSARLGAGNDSFGFTYGWPWVHLRVDGGSGNDRIYGSYLSDSLSGGSGNDLIDARGGGRDSVNCGPGRDRALIGPGDRVRGCERVSR